MQQAVVAALRICRPLGAQNLTPTKVGGCPYSTTAARALLRARIFQCCLKSHGQLSEYASESMICEKPGQQRCSTSGSWWRELNRHQQGISDKVAPAEEEQE